jgi:hypothetical protein
MKAKTWFAAALLVSTVPLAACESPLAPGHRGGPEQVSLNEPLFTDFTRDPEQGGRWLAGDFYINTDKTLANPTLTMQDFAQLEYTANQMKGVYITMTPYNLARILEARDQIRTDMGLPEAVPVSQAIDIYATRARGISDTDRQLLTQRRESLKAAMFKAGYAFQDYKQRLERQQSNDHEPLFPR